MMQMFLDIFQRYEGYDIDMSKVVADVVNAMRFVF